MWCDVLLVMHYEQEGERATGAWTRVKNIRGKEGNGGGGGDIEYARVNLQDTQTGR
jgi:hypothetical protein